MNIRQLSENLAVCAQITTADLDAIAQMGFKTIINNRPDGEELGQPCHADIAAKANALGLTIHHLPLRSGQPPSDALLLQFKQVMDLADKPILAFCRSGTRSGHLFQGACALG